MIKNQNTFFKFYPIRNKIKKNLSNIAIIYELLIIILCFYEFFVDIVTTTIKKAFV